MMMILGYTPTGESFWTNARLTPKMVRLQKLLQFSGMCMKTTESQFEYICSKMCIWMDGWVDRKVGMYVILCYFLLCHYVILCNVT